MKVITILSGLLLTISVDAQFDSGKIDSDLMLKAHQLAKEILIIDTHIDLPDWLYDEWFDVSTSSDYGEFDFVRANEGGLNVAFMSVYTSPQLEIEGKSKLKADSLIRIVERIEQLYPDKFKIVRSKYCVNINHPFAFIYDNFYCFVYFKNKPTLETMNINIYDRNIKGLNRRIHRFTSNTNDENIIETDIVKSFMECLYWDYYIAKNMAKFLITYVNKI